MTERKRIAFLADDGSGARDEDYIRLTLEGTAYAFNAGEIRDLRMHPNDELEKQQITEAYKIIYDYDDGSADVESVDVDRDMSRDLGDLILLLRADTAPRNS
ncbi:MAG: hypothetical protein AABW63_01800 [Nanoarchaeota archaeon]